MHRNLLDYVLTCLHARQVRWTVVSRETGIPYETLKKIAHRYTPNPGVKHVQTLADYFDARAGEPGAPCGCIRCLRERRDVGPPLGAPVEATRMVLCAQCGNKRCPHATDHRHACTGSNEPGQPGSLYGPPEFLKDLPDLDWFHDQNPPPVAVRTAQAATDSVAERQVA